MNANRDPDTPYTRLESTLGRRGAENEPVDADATSRAYKGTQCVPFDGPENRWREKAATLSWLELAIDHATLSWPTPMCGTELCLTLPHLAWEAPKRLEYAPGICVYCGIIAGTKDHLLPRTWTGEAVRRNVLTVPACAECNCSISDRYAPTITERRKIAQLAITRRNRRVLQMPEWSKPDLAELGDTLRSVVERGLHDRKLTRARLAWPEDRDYDLRAMQLSGIENPYEIGLLELPRKTRRAAS